uniref:Uncharacterized protein n=1 Tax=Medicago truncatula TaxID=3880 RepID=I3S031_MEDTR|nr:unknown [Medicago truncatula]
MIAKNCEIANYFAFVKKRQTILLVDVLSKNMSLGYPSVTVSNKCTSCSRIFSYSTENRNQTSHPKHLHSTSCPSSNSRTCYSSPNQTINPIVAPPVFLNPTSSNAENSGYKSTLSSINTNRVCHKRSSGNASKTLYSCVIGTSTQAPN